MDVQVIFDWITANPAAASALVAGLALVVTVLEKGFGLFSKLFGRNKSTPGSSQTQDLQASGQAIQARDIAGGVTLQQGLDSRELLDRLMAEKERSTKAEFRAAILEASQDEDDPIRARLLQALEDLQERARAPTDDHRAAKALQDLENEDPAEAEAIYREILESKRRASDEARLEAADAARHLGALAFLHDTDAALKAYEEAVQLDPENTEGLTELAEVYKRLGRLDDSERTFKRILAIGGTPEETTLRRAVVVGNIARIAQTRGDYERAKELLLESLQLSQELERFDLAVSVLGILGVLLYDLEEFDKAETFLTQALELDAQMENEEGIAINSSNLGLVHLSRNDLAAAKTMFEKALAIDRKRGDQEGESITLGNLGDVAMSAGDLGQAGKLLEEALAISQRLGYREGEADCLSRLGELAEKQGDIPAARGHWTAARDLYREIGVAERISDMEDYLAQVASPARETPSQG